MNKNEYRKKIDTFLQSYNFTVNEDSPITKSNKLVFDVSSVDECFIVKVTTDQYEIKAAEKLKGKRARHLAQITVVKDCIDFHIIVVEKLEPLSKPLIKAFKSFRRAYRRWIYLYYVIYFITFTRCRITLDKTTWLLSDNTLVWLDQARIIKRQAQQFGVENPSDYMDLNNLGVKMGTVSAFDVRDESDNYFYEKI